MKYPTLSLLTWAATLETRLTGLKASIGRRFQKNDARNSCSIGHLGFDTGWQVEIGNIFASSVDVEEAFQSFATYLGKLINLDRCSVVVYSDEPGIANMEFVNGIAVSSYDGAAFPLAGSVAEDLLSRGQSVILQEDDPQKLISRYPNAIHPIEAGLASVIGIPLKAHDRVIGAFFVCSTKRFAYTPKDFLLVRAIGSYIAGMIANMRLSESLKASRKKLDATEGELEASLRDMVDLEKSSTALFEAASQGILVRDESGRIIRVNDRAAKLFGYDKYELVGQPIEVLVPADQRDAHLLNRESSTTDPCPKIAANRFVSGLRKDGSEIPLEIGLSGAETPKGAQVIAFINDASERRILEQELRQAQKMESMGQLASGIAHDFNNLLTAIVGYNNLSRDALGPEHAVSEYLAASTLAAKQAASIVRQLLLFARQSPSDPQEVNLNKLIMELNGILGRMLGANIELVVLLDEGSPRIVADPVQMDQVLINLASNAKDAMPDGGELVIETEITVVDEKHPIPGIKLEAGKYVVLSVSDTGTGISEGVKPRIFEPFFTTKEVGKGTGLGLPTCYGIVKEAGGDIQIVDCCPQGTKFAIYLPLAEVDVDGPGASGSAQQNGNSVNGECGHETVLLVEDEPLVRRMAKLALCGLGYEVLEAGNGLDALRVNEVCGDRKIDILVTDIVMPKMGGLELAEAMRKIRPGIPVLFTSGYNDETLFRPGLEKINVSFLAKPYTVNDLANQIRETLGYRV